MTKRSKSRGFFHFIALRPVRNLILLAIVLGILFWQREPIISWFTSLVNRTVDLFGWGLAFIATAIIAILVLILRRKLSSLWRHWRYWLASVAFIAAAWGVLAFFRLGGNIGLGIIGGDRTPAFLTYLVGMLRVLGLVLLGIILVAPGASFHFIGRLISWPFRAYRVRQALKEDKAHREPLPSVLVDHSSAPRVREEPAGHPAVAAYPRKTDILSRYGLRRPSPRPELDQPAPVSAPYPKAAPAPTSQKEPAPPAEQLKQVAQEVWKKYGESGTTTVVDGWRLPPIEMLDRSPEIQFSQSDNVKRARLIEEALASYGVEGKVVQINTGPTVTQFGVEPGWDRKTKEVRERDRDGNVKTRLEEVSRTRVKVERINSLANDLSLALSAPTLRIEAPVPGKSVVGIEVPNTVSSAVSLRGVIETANFQKSLAKSNMTIALGKGAGGEAVAADLTKMPHLLIAGATGSGKTVCLNTIIACLLLNNTPYDIRFLMIDPKRVELTSYNSIPHLAAPVIVEAEKAVDALRWLSQEMNQRYQKMATVGTRNIEAYNKNRQGAQKMPYLVLVIDELADLMMTGGDEVERSLCRLAQLSRAVGIHLVVATQRPSVDVITGLIKANFPTRISFAVTSQVDSRTILDGGGAEKLLGKGDMLFMPTEAAKPKRLQGCLVTDPEIERLVYFWGNQHKEGVSALRVEDFAAARDKGAGQEDSLLAQARHIAMEHPHISASYLQRKLRIGYPRAARLIEELGLDKEANDNDDEQVDEGEEAGREG